MELDKLKTKDAVVAPKPQKQEHRFLGTVIRHPGLTLFEYNSKSKVVQVAEIDAQYSYHYNEKTKKIGVSTRTRVQVRDGCMYVQALNLKNAIRKVRKEGFEVLE
jgi:hypothetical protein